MQPSPVQISITEDDVAVREGLQLILERAGYETVIRSNPRELIEDTATLPDVYILDRQLPGIDGLDVCRMLKAGALTAAIPVIVISATPHVARLAAEAKADAFLEKPFRAAELLAIVKECLIKIIV